MAGFLDFVENVGDFIPGGMKAVPSWLAGLLAKKPAITSEAAIPYFLAAGQQAGQQNANFNNNYMPAAVNLNAAALGLNAPNALNETADRNVATAQQAIDAQLANVKRSMVGVNPNSGAAKAAEGAIRAAAPAAIVDAANKGRLQQNQIALNAQAAAIPLLNATSSGAMPLLAAGTGISGVGRDVYNQHRQSVGDLQRVFQPETKKTSSSAPGGLSALDNWLTGRASGAPSVDPITMGTAVQPWSTNPSFEDLMGDAL